MLAEKALLTRAGKATISAKRLFLVQVRGRGVVAVKSILWVVMIVALAAWSASALGQNSAGPPAGTDQGKKIFVSRCAQCHDDNAAKKLADGTTLLKRLAATKDPEMRLGTRLKKEDERRQVFLYLQPMIERERQSLQKAGSMPQ
ncbi:MAG TPA: hypothetical protein VFT65_00775 [Candidatus Angelobacter sp.]|nr:hypothetical protein [Candidatus Angelobacter sp.]